MKKRDRIAKKRAKLPNRELRYPGLSLEQCGDLDQELNIRRAHGYSDTDEVYEVKFSIARQMHCTLIAAALVPALKDMKLRMLREFDFKIARVEEILRRETDDLHK